MHTDVDADQKTRELAYRLWEEGGRLLGSPDSDWFRAEHDISETPAKPVIVAPAEKNPANGKLPKLDARPAVQPRTHTSAA